MIQKLEAVIFDLDGTLVDSMWLWEEIDKEYLGKYNIELPLDLAQEVEGMSFTETAIYFKKRFEIPDSIEKMKEEWNEMAWEYYMNQVPLKEGVVEFLTQLRESNIKMGIATSNSRELVMAILKVLDIEHYFDAIRTSCEVPKGKPYPDVYIKVAQDLDVETKNCLVFEDIPNGILAAKRAGMHVWAIADDYAKHLKKQVIRLADAYVEDYKEALQRLW